MNLGTIFDIAMQAVASIIEGLKGAGVPVGDIGDIALKDIETVQVDEANYLAGQAVPLYKSFSYKGKAGTIVLVANDGPAAQSLGL